MPLTSPMYRCTGVQQGGGGTSCDAVIEGTATIVTNATKVKKNVFSYDSILESFTGTSVTEIGESAFRNTTNLQTLSLGALTSIGTTAFYSAMRSRQSEHAFRFADNQSLQWWLYLAVIVPMP